MALVELISANETGQLSKEQVDLLGYRPMCSPLVALSCKGVTDLFKTLAIDRLHLREVASSIIGTNYTRYVILYI